MAVNKECISLFSGVTVPLLAGAVGGRVERSGSVVVGLIFRAGDGGTLGESLGWWTVDGAENK